MRTRLQEPSQAPPKDFYRAFEDRFRGSRELIQSRLRTYLPFIEPLKSIDNRPAAVDLGCGRGEWLELLTANEFDAQGVDLDEGMLAACHENGLRATQGDAVSFLQSLPDESQSIVSGFHIAEHLPFGELQALVEQALRVLKPAGLLILETPNPENIRVSSLTFYEDPTHQHPLPPSLLSFLPEYYGFARVKIVRLQESRELMDSQAASLQQVLAGVSPDYAVIAQKAADEGVARLFDGEFNKHFGLSADELIERFDRQQDTAEFARVHEALRATDAWARSLRAELVAREAELARARDTMAASDTWAKSLQAEVAAKGEAIAARDAELARMNAALTASAASAKALQTHLLARTEALAVCGVELARTSEALDARTKELAAVHSSTSWRITAPLRGASGAARWFLRGSRAWLTFRPNSRPRRAAHRLRMMLFPAAGS